MSARRCISSTRRIFRGLDGYAWPASYPFSFTPPTYQNWWVGVEGMTAHRVMSRRPGRADVAGGPSRHPQDRANTSSNPDPTSSWPADLRAAEASSHTEGCTNHRQLFAPGGRPPSAGVKRHTPGARSCATSCHRSVSLSQELSRDQRHSGLVGIETPPEGRLKNINHLGAQHCVSKSSMALHVLTHESSEMKF